MKTYLKKSILGYYVDFEEEIDAEYWVGQIGSTYQDFEDDKWILLSNEQLTFKEEHPDASIKEIIEMSIYVPEHNLVNAKKEKLAKIKEYDLSDNVNGFVVVITDPNSNEELRITSWLTPELRANYKSSIDAAELLNITQLSLYIGETPITLSTTNAKMMLALIQLYADQCFIVTKLHEAAVEALDTIAAVDTYNVRQGYPTKLVFNI